MLSHLVLIFIFACITLSDARSIAPPILVVSSTVSDPAIVNSEPIRFDIPEVEQHEDQPISETDLVQSDIPLNVNLPVLKMPDQSVSANSFTLTQSASTQPVKLLRGAASRSRFNADPIKVKHQYHGINFTGRRLIFIVDSSKSMRSKFADAKRELQRTLHSLTAEQTVSVYFYDQRVHLPLDPFGKQTGTPQPAAPQWVSRLTSWSETQQMDAGGSPERALVSALKFKPDTIFLLSDGEFLSGVIDRVTEANLETDGFGDRRRPTVIHCISFGAARDGGNLKKLAYQNGGTFRHRQLTDE